MTKALLYSLVVLLFISGTAFAQLRNVYPAFPLALTAGDCIKALNAFQGQDAGSPCGTGTINNAAQNSLAYYSAVGSSNVLSGLAVGTGVITALGQAVSGSSGGITLQVSPSFTTPSLGNATGTGLALSLSGGGKMLSVTSVANSPYMQVNDGTYYFNFGIDSSNPSSEAGFVNASNGFRILTNAGTQTAAAFNSSGNTTLKGLTVTSVTVGATAGVTCSGSPTGNFATSNGIVTHC
jgi:hypothetical protein